MKNYRPISMLLVLYEIFMKIISDRMRAKRLFNQPREEASSRKRYSTVLHIHVINQVIEKFAEYNEHLYTAFRHYESTFGLVKIPVVIEPLHNQGLQDSYLNILENVYTRTSQARGVSTRKAENYLPKKGSDTEVQCSSAIHCVLRREGLGMRINDEYLSNLRFADVVVLFSNTGDELQQMIQHIDQERARVGLTINVQKTKVIFNSLARRQEFTPPNQPLESVQEHAYLSQLLTSYTDHYKEIYRRIKRGCNLYPPPYVIPS